MQNFLQGLLISSILFSSAASAAALHINCKPMQLKIENKNIILPGVDNPKTSQIYFVQNVSQKSVWLDHPTPGRSASAGWSSYVQPQKWSAILVNRKNFSLSCAIIQPGEVDYQNCEKTVKVCIPQKVVFETKRKGSFWLAEDKTWEELLPALEKRGMKNAVEPAKDKKGKPVAHHEVNKKKKLT